MNRCKHLVDGTFAHHSTLRFTTVPDEQISGGYMAAKEPTIGVKQIEDLARVTFGETFARIEVKQRVRRSEKITIFIREASAKPGEQWTHKLTYAHDRPRGDPDAVRKHVITNLESILADRANG